MVLGIGVDIIEVARVQKAIERNPRFVDKVFTATELAYSEGKKTKFQHLAARFAAKEAFFQSHRPAGLMDGHGDGQFESGQPQVHVLSGEDFGFTRAHLSLTHLADYAIAMVVLEKD